MLTPVFVCIALLMCHLATVVNCTTHYHIAKSLLTSSCLHKTAHMEHSNLSSMPLAFLFTLPRKRFYPYKHPFLIAFLILAGDVHPNPGPTSSTPSFNVVTWNIRSLLNSTHSTGVFDLIDIHHPDLVCLTETWISKSATSAELMDATPPGYTLCSFPRSSSNIKRSSDMGGGTAFLVKEPCHILSTSSPLSPCFECSAITLKLPKSKLTIFNTYRPPPSKNSPPLSTVFDELQSFFSSSATTPHEFIITGDFNFHVDDPSDSAANNFLSLLSSFNLTQHVNFPTHNRSHTLDLVITSSYSSLSPTISFSPISPSDHFPVISSLHISPMPLPPPTLHSFRRLHNIDIDAFITDISSSRLCICPPDSLESLLISYDTTLRFLLDKHAPVITKMFSHQRPPNPWFTPSLRAFRSVRRHAENVWKRTHSLHDLTLLKTLTNRYHRLITAAKKLYYSDLVNSSADNPRRLWKTINSILHRLPSKPLPTCFTLSSVADMFAGSFY